MIYCASLGSVVKKSQQNKAFTTTIDRIKANMSVDPELSGMDAVILGPKDVMGVNSAKIQKAINERHPNVCVIYLWSKDNEQNLIQCEYMKQVKKLDDKAIDEAVTTFLGSHLIKTGKLEVQSNDMRIGTAAPPPPPRQPKKVAPPPPEPEPEPEENIFDFDHDFDAQTGDPIITPPATETEEPSEPEPAPFVIDKPVPATPETDKFIANIREFGDFELLKKALAKDRIIAEVLDENASYMRVQQMLDMLDKNIQTVVLDTSLSSEERYRRLQAIGQQRTEFKAQANDAIINKTSAIFDKVTSIIDEFVQRKVSEAESALHKITIDKQSIENGTVDILHLLEERTTMHLQLMELMRNIIDVYKSMDVLTADTLQQLDKDLPSSNEFVNSILAPSKKIFTPENTGALCSALMSSLQNQRITMSAMESRIKSVISVIFAICEQDQMIIEYQANLIKLLKANKVEDIVVIDSMLKGVMRLYVAAEDTGATATILTQSGLQSRSSNTLIVDMSGNGKWEDYGITPYDWTTFTTTRPHDNLCVVTASASNPEEVHEVIQEIKKSLDYYQYVNVKLDYTQTQVMSQICDDAIVVHFITDCRACNVRKIKQAVEVTWTPNIAKKVIVIDAPTDDILSIVTALGCDALTTKVIPIPHLTQMKGCALARKLPHQNDIIARSFEGAFR